MKNKILIIALIIIVIVGITWNLIRGKNGEKNKNEQTDSYATEQEIKNPDRLVVKIDSQYYEIDNTNEKYNELVEECRKDFNRIDEYFINQTDIDELKDKSNFVEFDYNTVSKNRIFFFSENVGTVRLDGDNGYVISKQLKNGNDLLDKIKDVVSSLEPKNFGNDMYRANNTYNFLPAVADFEEVKAEAVYKKQMTSYEEFNEIVNRYNIEFDKKINIEEKFNNNKVILFLTKYDIDSYTISVGNIKINFSGKDNIVENTQINYIPFLFVIGDVVNTNCIYYNYDKIYQNDNLTGTVEYFSGIVKSKNENIIELAYVENETQSIATVYITDETKILKNKQVNVGDFIKGAGVIKEISAKKAQSYDAQFFTVTAKEDYKKQMEDYVLNKEKISTQIVEYYESEYGGEGYAICSMYLSENYTQPDGYLKINYDNSTESYLGMENHIQGNYGIKLHEIVDITFKEKVKDVQNIWAKMFEYIAD